MDDALAYFQDFCSLIDLKRMKTVDDDTVSDPKPRPKRPAKSEIPAAPPDPTPPKKEYRLEKARKPKGGHLKTREEAEAPPPPSRDKPFHKRQSADAPKKFERRADRSGRDQKRGERPAFGKGKRKFETIASRGKPKGGRPVRRK
jgi:hypothetical protein